jgi:streptomycin 6-kinase
LPASASEQVVLHQDFHPGNVLAAERQPWLAIDPKPLVGDPAFDAAQLLLGSVDPRNQPGARRILARRVEELAGRLQLDASRIKAWAHARAVEWALWDLEVDERLEAERTIALAGLLAPQA